MRLKDKVAVVTGAGKGIGRGIAQAYAAEGARLVLAARTAADIEGLAEEIRSSGGQAVAVPTDVSDPGANRNLIERAVEAFGRVDILLTSAGISGTKAAVDITPSEWRQVLDINLSGTFFSCQAAARQMIQQGGGGRIITVSSIWGSVAGPERAVYCSSKAAVVSLTKVLAVEWAKHRINVNTLAPGYTRTELIQTVIDRGYLDVPAVERRTPLGRFGEVGDLVGAAVFLASSESSFMTGAMIMVDGGWTAYGYV